MADGDPYNSVQMCRELGCEHPIRPGRGPRRYCAEHAYPNLARYRGRYDHRVKDRAPRPESVIRRDLAEMLTVQVRRFSSMVAHDRATDPVGAP